MILLIFMTSVVGMFGQMLNMDTNCPADFDLLQFRDVYLEVYWEHEGINNRLTEFDRETAEANETLKDKHGIKMDKLSKVNAALKRMINPEQENQAVDCFWYHETHGLKENGVYDVMVGDNDFLAQCDMDTDGGGWTVIFSRDFSSHFDWNRNWQDYKDGFGDAYSRYWIGNDNIYELMAGRPSELYLKFLTENDDFCWAKYNNVSISSESEMYRIDWDQTSYNGSIDRNKCNATCQYIDINGRSFSSYDVDNDLLSGGNCAAISNAGWWYGECMIEEMLGGERKEGQEGGVDTDKLTSVVMMIRAMKFQ